MNSKTTVQKVVTAGCSGGAYYNFFRYGSDSLPYLIRQGWFLKFIHDDKEGEHVCAVFERDYVEPTNGGE